MNKIFDCTLPDAKLESLSEMFVPQRDVYYFNDEDIVDAFLHQGIVVYTRDEFHTRFPLFALEYGFLYQIWTMNRPKDVYVVAASPTELNTLPQGVRQRLLSKQIQYGRGHIYEMDWFNRLQLPKKQTTSFDGKLYYFLTWDDWWEFTPDIRKEWVLQWLRDWRKDDATGFVHLTRDDDRVPYDLVEQYAGRFPDQSDANCFAATIAMVVGGGTKRNMQQSRILILEWLTEKPFFRLLKGQGYSKCTEYSELTNLVFQPTDVLVWYAEDGVAGHAAYAVSNDSIFQKQGQGWANPWQILKINDVWYNEYLKTGGYIGVYRKE